MNISANITGETLTEELSQLGKKTLALHLQDLLDDKLEKKPQLKDGITYANMLHKSEAEIDWTQNAHDVHNHCRAMFSWPGSSTKWEEQTLKLFDSRVCSDDEFSALNIQNTTPGTVITAQKELIVVCAKGAVAFAQMQLPSKKRMNVLDAMRGRAISVGTVLGASKANDAGHE